MIEDAGMVVFRLMLWTAIVCGDLPAVSREFDGSECIRDRCGLLRACFLPWSWLVHFPTSQALLIRGM